MKGENVIFASIWLLLLNSLECAKNTYSASIKTICPHKESQPLENGVNKGLCSLPFELSVLSPLGIVTEDVCACTDVCVCVCASSVYRHSYVLIGCGCIWESQLQCYSLDTVTAFPAWRWKEASVCSKLFIQINTFWSVVAYASDKWWNTVFFVYMCK